MTNNNQIKMRFRLEGLEVTHNGHCIISTTRYLSLWYAKLKISFFTYLPPNIKERVRNDIGFAPLLVTSYYDPATIHYLQFMASR